MPTTDPDCVSLIGVGTAHPGCWRVAYFPNNSVGDYAATALLMAAASRLARVGDMDAGGRSVANFCIPHRPLILFATSAADAGGPRIARRRCARRLIGGQKSVYV